MSSDLDRYWFPAKRYGWGWGPPRCWQGWAILLGYTLLSALGFLFVGLPEHRLVVITYEVLLTSALLLVCWQKGEPPRWGDERNK